MRCGGGGVCGPVYSGRLGWQAGSLLGAVVSPTDAIAATSIAKRLGLPRGITDVLEGESLVKDATGLLALEFWHKCDGGCRHTLTVA